MSEIREKRISLEKFVVITYEKMGKTFELIVDPNKAYDFRRGKNIDISDVVVGYEIFSNARRGERAKESDIEMVFGTNDFFKIATKIVKEGEFKLTTEQRRRMIEEKKRKIIDIISSTTINPKTGAPHPPQRIESAMRDAKISIDPFEDVSSQVERIIKQLSAVIPISVERLKIKITFPPKLAAKGYNIVSKFGSIEEDRWNDDGSFTAVISIPAGIKEKVFEGISRATKGKALIEVVRD